MTHPEKQALLSELNHVKVLFESRTLAMHLGIKPPESLPSPPKDTQ